MEDLDVTIRHTIDSLFISARKKMGLGDKVGAIQDAESAWSALPDPKFEWDVSKSFVHALAKIYRDAGEFNKAVGCMEMLFASRTVRAHQDGPRFILATIYFEMGEVELANKWFAEANQISNGRCFQGEDKKYLEFYKKRVSGK